MEGWSERQEEGRQYTGMVHIFRIRELMKWLKSSVKMTRVLRGEGKKKKLERNMQNKLGRERKAARGVAKRGRGGEGERGS